MGEVLKKFGRYFLLDQIAQGGMAEIYRARFATIDNAGRLLVIKRIQAGFGANAEFLSMFKSEIKVTMGFSHPNIVQVYDFGEEQAQPYIAMELVDGKNLRQFIQRFNEKKGTFPVELAAFIIEQAASGLHYAHSFRDKISGESLNIVHRDISPQNILIAFEGTVKVIDFGIAKATTNSEATRAGVIKGKPSYLSPEQISGETLDSRCDIFALGTVLWELLTGKKLFQGENDLAVLKMIESCTTHVKPPSVLNPAVPQELDYIVLKALAKHRDKRYRSADELQRALHKFIYAVNPEFNPSDLSFLAKDMFKNEIVEDRKLILRLNERVEQLLQADKKPDTAVANVDRPIELTEEETTTVVEIKGAARPMEYVPAEKPKSLNLDSKNSGHAPGSRSRTAIPRQHSASEGSGKKLFFAGAVAAGLAIVFAPELGIELPFMAGIHAPKGAKLILQGSESGVQVFINGAQVATQLPATISKLPTHTPIKLKVIKSDQEIFEQDLSLSKGERKTVDVTFGTRRDIASANSTLLRLNVLPITVGVPTSILVNGMTIDPNRPVVPVPMDSLIELVVDRPGFRSVRREFTLASDQMVGKTEYALTVQLDAVKTGLLTIRTTPSAEARFTVNGKLWVRKTPIEDEKIPAGTYNIKLINEALGMEKNITISIEDGKRATVDERLGFKDERSPSGQ